MDQLSNVLQIHSHQQASHPHYQYLDNILISSSKQPTPPPHPPTHQDSPHQPQQDKKPRPPDETPKCPRCDSANTKFCYYNNYSLTQPRYFCKSCRRYWTKGGTLRNVPVGGGCRKNNKRSSSSSSSSSPSSPSSSLTSPSTLIKRTLLASSSHREFELDQQQPHHQMMMMMMMGGGGGGGNTNNTNSGVPHPTSTSGILHLPFSYDQDTSSCDLMNMAFARFQQRITHQGDQFGERESIDLDTTTIGNGVVTTSSIDSIIPRSHQNQGSGGGGDQSFMDSFRDGITYVNDDHHQHPQQQQSLNNNQPDTTNNNYNGGMNSFFHHNLNFLSYGLPAADENAHQNISGVSNDDKTEGLLSYDELNALNGGNTTTTTTTHSAAVTTSGAMKHEPLWGWTDQTKLPLGFPWQQVMKGNDGVGDEVGEKNWINVNGRMMNIGGLQVGMDY